MKQRLPTLLLALAALAALATLGTAAAQRDCPRGVLADRFCDRDGDLVADLPNDRTAWVNPDTLIFAFTPVEDPAVYRDVWTGFLEHLEAVTGKTVQFFAVDSNAAQLEAMRAGRLHVAGFNTGSVPFAVNTAGFRPFAMMAAADRSFGYEMEIIVPAGSDIETPGQLGGRSIAFTSPTSNSGFKAPSALLDSEFGLVADRDFSAAFSGGHDASILGVANGDYEAASIANSVKRRMIERDVFDPEEIRVIYTSQTFPTTAYGIVNDLDPELAGKIQEAFFSFSWEGSALEEEFGQSGEAQFIPITYLQYWAVIRQIDEATGVVYE